MTQYRNGHVTRSKDIDNAKDPSSRRPNRSIKMDRLFLRNFRSCALFYLSKVQVRSPPKKVR